MDPRAIIDKLFDRVAAKDLPGASELFATDAVFIDAVGPTRVVGRPAITEMIAEMWEGLPDVRVEVRAMASQGTTVMAEIEPVGTHLGSFMGRACSRSSFCRSCCHRRVPTRRGHRGPSEGRGVRRRP